MTDAEILQWVDSIELDLANVGSADDAWRIRQVARRQVYEVRGLKIPELRSPFRDTEPGQVT